MEEKKVIATTAGGPAYIKLINTSYYKIFFSVSWNSGQTLSV